MKLNFLIMHSSFKISLFKGDFLPFFYVIFPSYSAFPSGPGTDYSLEDLGGLKTQDVGEGNVKIR